MSDHVSLNTELGKVEKYLLEQMSKVSGIFKPRVEYRGGESLVVLAMSRGEEVYSAERYSVILQDTELFVRVAVNSFRAREARPLPEGATEEQVAERVEGLLKNLEDLLALTDLGRR